MRLLNTQTGEFVWVEDPRQQHYAALSHVWARLGDSEYVAEKSYQDILQVQEKSRLDGTSTISMFPDKLRHFCEAALKDGFKLGWADTCCIDKTNSSELSEAINSMYSWYAYSGACYAFLHDVRPPSADPEWRASFKRSDWFQRGWTLQELIASRMVTFVSKAPLGKGWEVLGSKHSLASLISSVTNIDTAVLSFEKLLEDIPVAQRMAWTQDRKTSRLEDEAYCLMGIFGVNMQTNYGEGRYAFIRLQEKILSESEDQTIFAWGPSSDLPLTTLFPPRSTPSIDSPVAVCAPPTRSKLQLDLRHNPGLASPSFFLQYLLASSSQDFHPKSSKKLVCLSREEFQARLGLLVEDHPYQVFEITPYGLRTPFPLLDLHSLDQTGRATLCAILACEDQDKGLLAILLRPSPPSSTAQVFFAGARGSISTQADHNSQLVPTSEAIPYPHDSDHKYYRLVYISEELQKALRTSTAEVTSPGQPITPSPRENLRVSIVYIPHRPSRRAIERDRDSNIHAVLFATHDNFVVEFCRMSWAVLEQGGFTVSLGPAILLSEDLSDHTAQAPAPAPAQAPMLTRNASLTGQNMITISDNSESGVRLTIQVGRCSCKLGQNNGVLGVMVCSQDSEAEDLLSSQDHHTYEHPIHVYSWARDHGAASKQFKFADSNDTGRKLSLRLILTSLIPRPAAGNASVVRRYRLSAELPSREEPRPRDHRTPLLRPRSDSRRRSNSLPPTPTSSQPTHPVDHLPGSYKEKRWLERGLRDHGESRIQTVHVALIALGAFLALVLPLLVSYTVQ